MKKLFLKASLIVSLAGIVFAPQASGSSPANHDCAQCHKLTTEDAVKVLKNEAGIPISKVIEVRDGPVQGVWEIAFEAESKKGKDNPEKGIGYLDYSKKKIIFGNVFDIISKKNLTSERMYEITKIDISRIPLDKALVMGDKNARYKVIVFTDPDCPFCGKLHAEIKKVLEKRKDIVFFLKLFPLVQIHPKAYEKSKAILCEKSIALLEDNFAGKPLSAPKCKTTEVDENIKLAEKLGISGTPAVIFPDGGMISGYREADALISLIERKP